MYEILVIFHVAAMVLSMALMDSALLLGFLGRNIAVRFASFGTGASMVGFVSGVGLLLDKPLSLKCAALTAYLVAVIVLYYVGYGFGSVSKARFIKSST